MASATRTCDEDASLPTLPEALRALAADAEEWQSQVAEWQRWEQRMSAAHLAETKAAEKLADALASRGEPRTEDLDVAVGRYETACRARADQAGRASRRAQLESAYARRLTDEGRVDQAREKRAKSEAMLRTVASAIGVRSAASLPESDLVDELTSWIDATQSAADAAAEREQQRGQLASLLGGGTLVDLGAGVAQAEQLHARARVALEEAILVLNASQADLAAAMATAGLKEDSLAAIELAQQQGDLQWKAAQTAYLNAVGDAKTAEGTRAERARSLTPVPEAIEAVEAARAEVDRLQSTASVLDHTARFLRDAQERVHRDIAPELARTLGTWLPSVTEGRYTDAIVDPSTLQVQVTGPDRQFRRADLLSYGTAEQVYLLLRASLTEHLTAGHDTCPLILDDPTVQADSVRLEAILDLLHQLSAERQIVVFAQQDEVAAWAETHLTDSRDRLTKLEQVVLV